MLKVSGVDLTSVGRFEPEPGDTVIALEDQVEGRYRKLVLADGVLVGAILLGFPLEASGVAEAVTAGRDLSDVLPALQAGDWSAFTGAEAAGEATAAA
jgi:nitrite reductase (NADH) large subunit